MLLGKKHPATRMVALVLSLTEDVDLGKPLPFAEPQSPICKMRGLDWVSRVCKILYAPQSCERHNFLP